MGRIKKPVLRSGRDRVKVMLRSEVGYHVALRASHDKRPDKLTLAFG